MPTTPDPGPASTVEDVVQALDAITTRARAEQSPIGYFPALYAHVTRTVVGGVDSGFFDDGPRMQHLVATFANRYLAALDSHDRAQKPTRCWGVTFEAASDATPIVLQHLLLGINAHINLDLGIAAAHVAPGEAIWGLRRDFDRINQILAMMTAQAQQTLGQISPWLGLLDTFGGRTDDDLVRFSIEVARAEAWRFAIELAQTPTTDHQRLINGKDRFVADLARRVRHPGFLTPVLWLIRLRESKDVPRNLDLLASMHGPDLTTVEAQVEDAQPSD